jgi:hypothetical protein
MNDLLTIRESVNNLSYDIKAEIVIADLIENGFNQQDYIIYPDGLFRRRFKKDVSHAEVIEFNNGKKVLGIHLTRESIYDALPEAIFHGPPEENLTTGHEMAKASKIQKKEEKECRMFFLPFENEIFYQKVQLELSERKILHRFSENLFNDIFPEFWNLDRSLPKELVSKLMLFLHYSHKFAGDSELTARALEVILNEKVEVRLLPQAINSDAKAQVETAGFSVLGSSFLGQDLICGDHSDDQFPVMEFIIGPLENTSIEDYLDHGPITRFLDVFFSYFVPMDFLVSKKIKVAAARKGFVISDKGATFLGYNTVLA